MLQIVDREHLSRFHRFPWTLKWIVLGQVQKPYFKLAESNANEGEQRIFLICIRFGSCEVRRLNLTLSKGLTHCRAKAPSTLICFQTKTELFCSGYCYHPHYNAENDHQKRSNLKMLSRVERSENDAFWKRCFLVWTEKTMLPENGNVIKTDTTGRQITWPWVSKMVDKRYHMASILRADILKCAGVKFIWACALRV